MAEVNNVDLNELVDIRSIKVDKNLPYEERLLEYLRQIKNPYHCKCGKYSITFTYRKNGLSLNDCIRRMIWI